MISYHPTARGRETPRDGFRAAPVVELARVARCIIRYVWSPVVWREGKREEANFLESFWCAYDFEDASYSLRQACSDFADTKHVIATTQNHRVSKKGAPPVDRFRVVVPWAEPIADLRIYRFNMRCETRRYPIDASCIDGARLFFPGREVISVNDDPDAYAQPVRYDVPEGFEDDRTAPPKDVELMRQLRAVSPFAEQWLKYEMPSGKRNTYCYGIAKDLAYAGIELAEIRARILASPTYRGRAMSASLLAEINETTRNGARAAAQAMAAAHK